jgi:hypothetical protein
MTTEEIQQSLVSLRGEMAGRAKRYGETQKAIDAITKALKDPVKNAATLTEAVAELKKAGGGLVPAETFDPLCQALEGTAEKSIDDASFLFAKELRDAFAGEGVSLTGSGDRFIADIFLIQFDKRRAQVHILFGKEALTPKPIGLDPQRVLSAFKTASKALTFRKVDYPELLGQFYEAYQRVLNVSSRNFGDRVSVVDCYSELVWTRQSDGFRRAPTKSAFVDYPRSLFTFDMMQLRKQNILTHKSYKLHFGTATIDATGNDRRSIWMPDGAEEGHYVMDVYWKKEA